MPTYPISGVALKNASVDLDICMLGIDCSALSVVACPPPGIGAKENQEGPRKSFVITYMEGIVALEGAVVDLHIGKHSIDSSTLEVACGPPGIGANI
jgi:hypothetical protein